MRCYQNHPHPVASLWFFLTKARFRWICSRLFSPLFSGICPQGTDIFILYICIWHTLYRYAGYIPLCGNKY